ncbi:MAG: hypothetical protein HOP12_02350 [Candidatus Eisenbacteria bacterium]|uniref:Uncharacterized protein n=1 Tax=Eiseniibacteriota bacterium TaxID=2212470 RepID=A0A849SET2_UNCEI|nr:hypothetical protein [Candidatus Eisenbacteria bacterium]
MKVALQLFHGRKDPTEDMDDWGEKGPVFLVDYVHVTYRSDLKLGIPSPAGDGDLKFVDDLVFYDGRYYGDWSVFPASLIRVEDELAHRVQPFDPQKARLP